MKVQARKSVQGKAKISPKKGQQVRKTPGAIASVPFKSALEVALICAAFVGLVRFRKRLSFPAFSLATETE